MKQVGLSLTVFFFLAAPLLGERVNKSFLSGIAVEGTDVVAYFTEGRAVPGKPEFSFRWKGAKWIFASAEHRDLFAKSPDKYAPQYGGFCAYAVGNNYTAGIDPHSWAIVNGKLYLNYDSDIKKKWEANRDALIRQAEVNWPLLDR